MNAVEDLDRKGKCLFLPLAYSLRESLFEVEKGHVMGLLLRSDRVIVIGRLYGVL